MKDHELSVIKMVHESEKNVTWSIIDVAMNAEAAAALINESNVTIGALIAEVDRLRLLLGKAISLQYMTEWTRGDDA